MVADGDTLMVVPPSHPLERVYFHRSDGGLVASNSLVAVLETRGLQLDPNVLYPPIFVAAADGVRNPTMDVPTSSGVITTGVYYNFSIGAKSEIRVEGRPREWPFTSFEDFKGRVTAALRSAVANAPPGYEMAVSLSSGYDNTASGSRRRHCQVPARSQLPRRQASRRHGYRLRLGRARGATARNDHRTVRSPCLPGS